MTKSLVLIVLLVLGAAFAVASNADAWSSRHEVVPGGVSGQCRLPVSQRTGGWVCPGG